MIRRALTDRVKAAAAAFPAVTITGPRQSGKSTLCRALFPEHDYVNLEQPDLRAFAQQDPRGFLGQYPDGAVIDEIQRCPELPSYLQGLIDADPRAGKWILTGSQNLSLLASVSQSLAGRTAILHLLPLTRAEVCRFGHYPLTLDEAMLAGGYPRIFDEQLAPADWLAAYVGTYIERDVRSVSNVGDLTTFQRFVELCAGRSAQLLNISALAADAGIAQPTAKAWLSILETSFIVTRLPPFHANIRKRLVKMPKLHFYDTGLLCWLLGLRSVDQLRQHPLRGAIFETWVVSEILKHRANQGERGGIYFYRDRQGTEADVIVQFAHRYRIVEAKAGHTIAPDMLHAARRVATALGPDQIHDIVVVYGGDASQDRTDARVLPWHELDGQPWAVGRPG
ncbi:MAG: ATP-binding protein [Phycisphaerae bacterium]|nr:ATP-binding protein [Phycisphaerae bacterium]